MSGRTRDKGANGDVRRWRPSGPWRDRACPSWRWTCRRSCRGGLGTAAKDIIQHFLERRRARRGCEGLTLDNDVTVLAKGRALHGEGERGPGGGLCGSGRTKYEHESCAGRARRGRLTCSKLWLCCSSSDMMRREGGRGGLDEKEREEGEMEERWKHGADVQLAQIHAPEKSLPNQFSISASLVGTLSGHPRAACLMGTPAGPQRVERAQAGRCVATTYLRTTSYTQHASVRRDPHLSKMRKVRLCRRAGP